jgi:hypothetical protein
MNPKKIKTLVTVLLISLCALACGSENAFDQQVAVVVALTQTAAVLGQPSATSALQLASPEATLAATDTFVPLPTSTPTGASSPSYQPLSADECNTLQVALAQSVGFPGNIQDPAPFTDYTNQKSGTGCLVSFSLTSGLEVKSMDSAVTSALQSQGWNETTSYAAAGPADTVDGYQKADALCLTDSTSAPSDASLCPKDANYYHCLGNLQPSQVVHTVTVNCAKPVP